MTDTYKISEHSGRDSALAINAANAGRLGIESKRRAYVSFGNRKYFVNIELSNAIKDGTIMLSKDIIDYLHVPLHLDFEITLIDNEIILGPYIGVAAAQKESTLGKRNLRRMLFYAKYYSILHGAIVVFAMDRVDKNEQLIEGYCYNPIKNEWEKGLFPYPGSIYRRTFLNEEWQNHFLGVIGDRVFNYHFTKWDMYKWFSADEQMAAYFPHTVLFNSYRDIMEMLQKYSMIYVKPLSKSKGRGVVQVSKARGSICFSFRKDGKNHRIVLHKKTDARHYIEKNFRKGRYLVQQAVDLIKYGDSIVDFRCAVQKNQAGKWVIKAVVARCGAPESVVSNICAGGCAAWADELLAKIYEGSSRDASSMLNDMNSLVLKVCNALDRYGIRTGNLGLDIGIDSNGQMWVIEINNRFPEPLIAMDVNDRALYDELRINPLFYAKALAGFNEEKV